MQNPPEPVSLHSRVHSLLTRPSHGCRFPRRLALSISASQESTRYLSTSCVLLIVVVTLCWPNANEHVVDLALTITNLHNTKDLRTRTSPELSVTLPSDRHRNPPPSTTLNFRPRRASCLLAIAGVVVESKLRPSTWQLKKVGDRTEQLGRAHVSGSRQVTFLVNNSHERHFGPSTSNRAF